MWKKQGGSNRTTTAQNLSTPYFTNDISGSALHLEVMNLDISNVRILDQDGVAVPPTIAVPPTLDESII